MASYAQDIQPLFREHDRNEMEWAFDLWDYEDVKEHADAILERLEAGSMPCDGAWPADQIERFREWVSEGMEP